MPVVGFHQARRPRLTLGTRLRRGLSWPRPGGIAVSVAGAALVFSCALAFSPAATPQPPAVAAAPSLPSTTTDPAPAPSQPSPVAGESGPADPSSAPPTLSVSGNTAAPIQPATTAPVTTAPATTATAPPVTGAAPDAPIQELFATGSLSKTDPLLLDIDNPGSPLVLVNKHRLLAPKDYAPADLVTPAVLSGSAEPVLVRAEAAAAAERMFAAAAADGVSITVKSSYRSFDTQVSVYNGYVANKGEAAADSTSARPGYSEHQTGLAIDIGDANADSACDFNSCFAETAAGQWVAAHGTEHGFAVRYVPGAENVTGYLAEPWHLRYLGTEVAQDMKARGIHSYEEYLGLPGAPGYK
ncbi:M15 family metallopeptidase [Specibacter sp. AOP5-B1-6]|uniref:M15 family metallopeptidase n=1 Tax=Specibacter sp. AOP5-B1-6 TaxID=3457653 RepID=UPI00402BE803